MNIIKRTIYTLLLASLIFSLTIGPLTKIVSAQIDLSQYLYTDSVSVGTETVNEYSQVYYQYNGTKTFITSGPQNSRSPFTRGEYLVYVQDIQGAGQIFLYHIPSGVTTQLTYSSTNLNPHVDRNGQVAWERWLEGQTWQIFYFDGSAITQISSGDTAINADIDNGYIVFDRHDQLASLWHTVGYEIASNHTADISVSNGASEPLLVNSGLELKDASSRRSVVFQNVANVFALDLPTLGLDPATVSSELEPDLP